MELTDLCPLEKWTELEKKITERSGLDANVFNTDGVRITRYKHWANRLCPAIKNTDKGQSFICAVAHMNIATVARNTKAEVIEECDAGLVKMVVPIFVDNEFLGAVGACGKLLDDGEVDDFLINMITEIDENTIRELSDGLDRTTSASLREMAEFIKEELGQIIFEYRKTD